MKSGEDSGHDKLVVRRGVLYIPIFARENWEAEALEIDEPAAVKCLIRDDEIHHSVSVDSVTIVRKSAS